MKTKLAILGLCLTIAFPLVAQKISVYPIPLP
jgi:hypothetical protein